ncbi:MAG: hypothetical protein ACR2MP_02265 [Streptosporangiaceae bacterium]
MKHAGTACPPRPTANARSAACPATTDQHTSRPAAGSRRTPVVPLDPPKPRTARAALTAPMTSPAGRRSFTCGILDHAAGTVTPAAGRSSHQLTALARCDALIIVPEQVTVLPAASTVEVLELRP